MNKNAATPKDAAAIILLNQDQTKVLWAQRNPQIPFLGGWHAFPGGKTDAADAQISVKNSEPDLEKFIAAAAREIFEEVGILLARGGDKLTKGQRASLHDDLVSGRSTFGEILEDWDLWLDADDFFYTGFWTTPQFSPVRFKTRFFMAVCPAKQTPYEAISEMRSPEFIAPREALARWAGAEVLISPPVLISLQELAAEENLTTDGHGLTQIEKISEKLLERSRKCDGAIHHIELNPHLVCFPVKTDTLPPATHTNCFIVGKESFDVIDPASPFEEDQNLLHQYLDSRIEKGDVCYNIFLTHEHKDHIGGVTALQRHLKHKFDLDVQIVAHSLTAERLPAEIKVERFIDDLTQMKFYSEDFGIQSVRILHTPGHARGHLCFYFEKRGFLLSGDNVVGAGTVVIAPPEGNMTDYLNSLERMKNLPNLKHLCGSHGAAVFDARAKIEEYIAHRLERERQILEAIKSGAATAEEIARSVYRNLKPDIFPLAVKSVEAHLAKLKAENLI